MKTNPNTRRGFTLVELLVVIVIIASLAGLTAPMVIRQRKKADQTEATSNARQIGIALFEFEVEYGSYPDTGTVADIGTEPFEPAAAVAESEDAFRQLFVAGITTSEDMFFAKIKNSKKPDGDYTTATTCLDDGENGFAYVMENSSDALSTGGNSSRFLIATPMVSTTAFDPGPFDGKAVYLRIDNSVVSTRIKVAEGEESGPAEVKGKDILATGTGSVWTTAPTVVLQANTGT